MKIALGILLLIILVLVLRVGELYTQLARYQRYWDRVNQKPIEQDSLVYIAFGDSAAQGVGATKPEKGYVGLLAEKLADKEDKFVQVINLSKSGATIKDVLNDQLPKYDSLGIANRKVITIDIGANDVVKTGLKGFEDHMESLLSELPDETIVADIPSFAGSRYARLEPQIKQANKIIYKLAGKYGFKVAGVYDKVAENHGIRTFAADVFHPSNHGYKSNWLPAFLKQL